MQEIEEIAGAQSEAGHGFSAVQSFALAIDDAGFDERHHAIGAHLGVNAEIAFINEAGQHGIGNAANTHLQGGAIGNERRHVPANAALRFGWRMGRQFQQGAAGFHHGGDFADMDE